VFAKLVPSVPISEQPGGLVLLTRDAILQALARIGTNTGKMYNDYWGYYFAPV